MQTLNHRTTKLFLKLIKQLGSENKLEKEIPGLYPFTIKRLDAVKTPFGPGTFYSLTQTTIRPRRDGQPGRFPEIHFLVVDRRKKWNMSSCLVNIFPQRYLQDSPELIDQVSFQIGEVELSDVNIDWQIDQCTFVHSWFKNLKKQGFFRKPKIDTI